MTPKQRQQRLEAAAQAIRVQKPVGAAQTSEIALDAADAAVPVVGEEEAAPRPGELHPVDQAFYDLTVKERDYERRRYNALHKAAQAVLDAAAEDLDVGTRVVSSPLSDSLGRLRQELER